MSDEALDPLQCLMRSLQHHEARGAASLEADGFLHELAAMPFAHLHAKWPAWASASGRSERWSAVQQPFAMFAARYRKRDELVVWEGTVPNVPVELAVQWLVRERFSPG